MKNLSNTNFSDQKKIKNEYYQNKQNYQIL